MPYEFIFLLGGCQHLEIGPPPSLFILVLGMLTFRKHDDDGMSETEAVAVTSGSGIRPD